LRWEVTRRFNRTLASFFNDIQEVGLVGGGLNEPELEMFREVPSVKVAYLGIEPIPEHDFTYLDLNCESDTTRIFDLVICSQVLEHVWNHESVFNNLTKLVKPGGLLWIGCPASNYAHGSPGYFSAGFAPEYIENNLKLRGFEVVISETFGSKRYYFLTHALQIWGNKSMHSLPMLFGFSRFYPRELFLRFVALTRSSRIKNEIQFATETIVLLRKTST